MNIDFIEFEDGASSLQNPTTEEGAHVVSCCSCAQVEISQMLRYIDRPRHGRRVTSS